MTLTAREKSELLDRVELFAGLGSVPLSALRDVARGLRDVADQRHH